MDGETVTLWRPVGPKELKLIEESGMCAFPPRLPEQPIFYPPALRGLRPMTCRRRSGLTYPSLPKHDGEAPKAPSRHKLMENEVLAAPYRGKRRHGKRPKFMFISGGFLRIFPPFGSNSASPESR